MCHFLSKQNITFDDCANKDGLKHMLCPLNQECHRHGNFLRAPTEMIDKAIFMFGDILHGLHSIYRRGWAKQHFRGNFGKVVPESWSNFTLAPEEGDPSGVLSQIQNWQNASVPVLFIDFHQINSEYTRSAIQQFVGRTNLTLPKFDESKITNVSMHSTAVEKYYMQQYEKLKKLNGKVVSKSVAKN